MKKSAITVDGLTIHIPMTFRRRGGRKYVVVPDGLEGHIPAKPRRDDTLLKALARAHRWRRMIEGGQCRSITDLAGQEEVTEPYVSRILALTVLAPDITEAIIDGRQPRSLKLSELLRNMPLDWNEQRETFGFTSPGTPEPR
jgi:hypothetical protein